MVQPAALEAVQVRVVLVEVVPDAFKLVGMLGIVEHEPHVIHTAKKPEPEIPEKVTVPDYAHLLPESIRKFTLPSEIHDAGHLSFIQGGGHGGSHPHRPIPRDRRAGRRGVDEETICWKE